MSQWHSIEQDELGLSRVSGGCGVLPGLECYAFSAAVGAFAFCKDRGRGKPRQDRTCVGSVGSKT